MYLSDLCSGRNTVFSGFVRFPQLYPPKTKTPLDAKIIAPGAGQIPIVKNCTQRLLRFFIIPIMNLLHLLIHPISIKFLSIIRLSIVLSYLHSFCKTPFLFLDDIEPPTSNLNKRFCHRLILFIRCPPCPFCLYMTKSSFIIYFLSRFSIRPQITIIYLICNTIFNKTVYQCSSYTYVSAFL